VKARCAMDAEMTAQARAARVTYILALRGEITTDEVRQQTGIETSAGVIYLMKNIGTVIPIEKRRRARWGLREEVKIEGAG